MSVELSGPADYPAPPSSAFPWHPITDASQTRRARHIALQVAARLQRPGDERVTEEPAMSLANGDCGAALLFGYLADCTGDPAWTAAAHQMLQHASADAQHRGPVTMGLFDGIAGVGFAAAALSAGGRRYQRLLETVDRTLCAELETLRRNGTAIDDFDAISGLAGIGVYFLQRTRHRSGLAAVQTVTALLLGHPDTERTLPRWARAAERLSGPLRELFPGGCFDCGVAHGIPGPLAFLGRARLHGVRGPRLDAAITDAVTWLLEHRMEDRWGPNWPSAVPLDDDSDRSMWRPSRAAWCYGAPGVARALWLAGLAMNQPDWCEVAVTAMTAVCRRPRNEWMITSSGLCHGLSGLLQINLRFYHDTRHEVFLAQAQALTAELLEQFDPHSAYGYPDARADDDGDGSPGLLDGANGVAATLLAAAGDRTPMWDQVMLLA